jgi:hypothetical protein
VGEVEGKPVNARPITLVHVSYVSPAGKAACQCHDFNNDIYENSVNVKTSIQMNIQGSKLTIPRIMMRRVALPSTWL